MAIANPEAIVDLVERTRVHRRLFVDPDIFELEMKLIYENTWVYVGYEDETREPGDYITTYIGRQPVIVTRDEDGEVNVLMNRCMHRGATVCRAERGSGSFLRCPYHGWTYQNNGKLIRVPLRYDYPDDFDAADLALRKPPKVGTYRGFIFASLNADVPSLKDHLGNTKKFLDWYADVSVGHYEIELPQRVEYLGNWKLIMENTLDGYHPPFTHESMLAVGLRHHRPSGDGEVRDLGNGQGTLRMWLAGEDTVDSYIATLRSTIGEERMRAALLDNQSGTHIRIFPNMVLLRDRIRVIYPQAVDHSVFSLRFMYPRGVGDAERARRRHNVHQVMGHGGFNTPEDVELFARVHEGMKVEAAEWYLLSRGMGKERFGEDGDVIGAREHEQPQRSLYYHWKSVMADRLAKVPL